MEAVLGFWFLMYNDIIVMHFKGEKKNRSFVQGFFSSISS
jgi:hypothetical protein